MRLTEPFLVQHPWGTALLLGTVVTPAGVVLGWLAPRPLDAVVALPLVLVDIWATRLIGTRGAETPIEDPLVRLLLLAVGIVLTWMFYVLAARVVLSRLAQRVGDGSDAD